MQPRRRLSRNEYEGLTKKHKAKYDEQFPKSRHRTKHKASKRAKGDYKHDARETKRQAGTRRKSNQVEVDKQRNVIVDDGAGVINKESVKALAVIKSSHLHQAAANIENNRDEVHDLIEVQLRDKPNFKNRGLEALREMMEGGGLLDAPKQPEEDAIEGEFEEINDDKDSEGESSDDHEVGDPQYTGKDGKPASFSDGRPIKQSDVERFKAAGGKVKLPKKLAKSQYVDENGDPVFYDDGTPMTMQDKAEDDFADIRKAMSVKRSTNRPHKDSKKQRDGKSLLTMIVKGALVAGAVGLIAVAAGPLSMVIARGMLDLYGDMRSLASKAAADMEKSEDERNYDTVDEVITQTVSYLRNMDMDDLHDHSKEMFSALAAQHVDIYQVAFDAILPLVHERPRGRVGKNFFGGTYADMQSLADAIGKALDQKGVLKEHEYYKSDIDECHLFYCTDAKRTLVALGMNETMGIYHVALLNW